MRAYSLFNSPRSLKVIADEINYSMFSLIEKTRLTVKSHRCSGEQDMKFILQDDLDKQVLTVDDQLCATYLTVHRSVFTIYDQVNGYLSTLDGLFE